MRLRPTHFPTHNIVKPPDVDRRGRPYTIPPRDPSELAPWLAWDDAGNLLVLIGTAVVATLDASVVAELKAAARDGRTTSVVLERP